MAEAWEEKRYELVTRDGLVPAIRSAPWSVWVGVALYFAIALANAAVEPRVGTFIAVASGVPFSAAVLAGFRIMWQIAILFAVGDIVFVFAPHGSVWSAAGSAIGLVFLLLPTSRRYFRPGRVFVSRKVARRNPRR
jgi:hypothetical protein